MDFYVYIYLDPRKPGKYVYNSCTFAYEPFYIGKGIGNRVNSHLHKNHLKIKSFKNNKIKKILSEGYNIKEYILIITCESEQDAFDLEIKLISDIGRHDLKKGPLTNLTDGGEGFGGLIKTDEHKKKIGKANKGKIRTEETKRKLSEIQKGRTYEERMGVEMTERVKKEKSKWMKGDNNPGKNPSEETRRKMSKSYKNNRKGKKHSEEAKRKMSEKAKGRIYNLVCKECNKKFKDTYARRKKCKKCRGDK